jgi:hypothetical protein
MNERALCFAIGILEQYHVTPPRARGVTGPRQQAPYGTMGATTAEMQSAQADLSYLVAHALPGVRSRPGSGPESSGTRTQTRTTSSRGSGSWRS